MMKAAMDAEYKFLDDLQIRLWEVRRRLTYSSRKWKYLRQWAGPVHDRLHKLLLEMENIREEIIKRENQLKPMTEDTSIPYLHWADATPFQRKLIWEGVTLRGYEPNDEEPPRARVRRTDTPR